MKKIQSKQHFATTFRPLTKRKKEKVLVYCNIFSGALYHVCTVIYCSVNTTKICVELKFTIFWQICRAN